MQTGILILWGALLAGASLPALPQQGAPPHGTVLEQDRVDINHATLKELLKIPGMRESWAGRILRFRPYHTKQDLLDRGIVNGDLYYRIKDYIIAHREKQSPAPAPQPWWADRRSVKATY